MKSNKLLSYGYESLDALTGGLRSGELVLLGARPGMGTSRFLYNIVSQMNCEGVIFVSDHDTEEYKFRLQKLRQNAEKDELSYLSSGIDIHKFISDIKKIKQLLRNTDRKYRFLVIDALRLLQYSEDEEKGEPCNFGNIFDNLKVLAKELSIPVIVTVKWPRLCEARFDNGENPRPNIDDLSSTNIPTDIFDTVLMLYRDDYYYFDDDNPDIGKYRKNTMEVIVGKSLYKCGEVCSLHYNHNTGLIGEI